MINYRLSGYSLAYVVTLLQQFHALVATRSHRNALEVINLRYSRNP
jgi:hypothetical protein